MIEKIMAIAQKPARDRTAHYAFRLDGYLARLPDNASRAAFCKRERAKWEERYREFAHSVDTGAVDLTGDHPTAWDYTLTLAHLDKQVAAYERGQP